MARLIPAHAGKTGQGADFDSTCQAHPRSRGENLDLWAQIYLLDGSSPLTRGKPRPEGRQTRRQRLIPAHAGKTSGPCRARARSWAHPRSRGENARAAWSFISAAGSSPLTRGKLDGRGGGEGRGGLIPAHAGKTQFGVPSRRDVRAHPRSRGENTVSVLSVCRGAGSSPLTRGKPLSKASNILGSRLIPAHAGKTRRVWLPGWPGRAHPRSRGENPHGARSTLTAYGSSPLTRGKLRLRRHVQEHRRLIPAHAGKTVARWAGASSMTAHPRSRGENTVPLPHA